MQKKRNILAHYRVRILLAFSLIIFVVISVAALRTYNLVKQNASEKIFSEMQESLFDNTFKIKNIIESKAELAVNMSLIIGSYTDIIKDNRRTFYENMLLKLIEDDISIYSIWTVFKPFTIDDLDDFYSKPFEGISGQYAVNYNKENEHIVNKKISPDDYVLLEKYIPMFNSNQNVLIIGPIEDPYWQLAGNSYIVRIVAPIVNNNKVIGIVGIDINLKTFDPILNQTRFGAYILDDDLQTIYSNDNNSIVGKSFLETYPYVTNNYDFLKNISLHNNNSEIDNLFSPNDKVYYSLFPIYFESAKQYWNALFYVESDNVVLARRNESIKIFIAPLIVFLVVIITMFIVFGDLTLFFFNINTYVTRLAKGKKSKPFKTKRKNIEMREIQTSLLDVSVLLEKHNKLSFEILEDNFEYEKGVKYIDPTTQNLIKIKDKFLEEKKIREEQNQVQKTVNLVSNAVADINNIQREFVDDIEQLAYETIKYISNFIDALQGGIYVLESPENETPFLNLVAFYSYNRRIYNKKKVELGDGLAGTCAQEQNVIYTRVPEDYLEISSGLGKVPPNYIYLLPLVIHGKLFGIVEIAFLEKLKDYHIQFLSAISEIIAATISTAETNTKTKQLLDQTQNITNEMREKEELMDVQIKELESLKTRSEMVELDKTAVLGTIDTLTYFAEFDVNGNVLSINKNLSEKIQIQVVDALMKTYYDILFVSDVETHQQYLRDVLNGKTVEFEHNIAMGKFDYWFNCILAPVYNAKEQIYKIIFFAIEYTEIVKREKEMKKMMIDINEKSEQISVQEQEMNDFFVEFQNATEDVQILTKKVSELEEEKNKSDQSMEFISKEFRKRANRSKRIEMTLKKKIKLLENEINKLKGNN